MKYQPKFQKCPYRTCNGQCSHKKILGKECIYNKPSKCKRYNEWADSKKLITEPPMAIVDDFHYGGVTNE
jgi:hypothetical protein